MSLQATTTVEAVTAVAVDRVRSVRPGHTDTRVDTDVTVVLELSAADADLGSALTDGFGITRVNEVEHVDPVREP